MIDLDIDIPDWALPLYDEEYTYCCLYGGRSSAKSYTVADFFIISTFLHKDTGFLCCRQVQKSIEKSAHSLMVHRIKEHKLEEYFNITQRDITNLRTNSQVHYLGLERNPENVKSIPNLGYLWIEEADTISSYSWELVIPTVIRNNGCKIIVTFNPNLEGDVVYKTFVTNDPPLNSYVKKLTYRDNPFPMNEAAFTEIERKKQNDYEGYLHIYEGYCRKFSEASVFKDKWKVKEFEEDTSVHKYFGLDFGFSQDPTAGVRCYVVDNTLYITHEAVQIGLEIDDTGQFLVDNLPDIKGNAIYADNARPETISYINKKEYGFSVYAADKGKGSIEDGIEYIKSFDQVIIHTRCPHTANEFSTYSYKVDERSGDITNKIIDANNDILDALRYSLERRMKRSKIDYANKMKLNAGRF